MAEEEEETPMNEVCNRVIADFQEETFTAKVEVFVNCNIDLFATVCHDGSHPLEWSRQHEKYKLLYETQLEKSVFACGADMTKFMEYMEQCNEHYGNDPGFQQLMTALTACVNYSEFIKVMFAAVIENWVPEDAAPPPPHPDVQVHEPEVVIPEGWAEGMVMPIEYLGISHQVTIPGGYASGSTLKVSLEVPVA